MAKQQPRKTDGGGLSETAVPTPGFEFFMAEGLAEAAQSCARTGFAVQEEMLRFTARRWEEDLRLPLALAGCQSFGDLLSVQQKWLDTAFQDYAEEGERLARLAGGAVRDTGDRLAGGTAGAAEASARLVEESGQLVE